MADEEINDSSNESSAEEGNAGVESAAEDAPATTNDSTEKKGVSASQKKSGAGKSRHKKHSIHSSAKKRSLSASHSKGNAAKQKGSDSSCMISSCCNRWMIGAAIIIIIALLGFTVYKFINNDNNNQEPGKYGTVSLEFYVMSKCPYGTQVEDAVAPALKKLGNSVNFTLNFIGDYTGDKFSSMHGDSEVAADIADVCAMKYAPLSFMDMIVCMNRDASSMPGNWEECAREANISAADISKAKKCYEGAEGKSLLKSSFDLSRNKQVSSSPTIYLNGKEYSGARDELSFMRELCLKLNGQPECAKLPKPARVDMILLNDKRCQSCDVSRLIPQLKGLFPGLEVKELDYGSSEGKKIYSEAGVNALPALLFDSSVVNDTAYSQIARYIEEKGKYLSLRIGASFDPTKEICDNSIDDNGNGKIDCADSDCAGTLACRPEVKGNIQVFIMSDCPYGKEAIKALKQVADNFGSKISYDVHYIAGEDGKGGFTSLHGAYEASEDIVQLCAKKYNPKEWLSFADCRSIEGIRGNDWHRCANASKLDIAKVEACATGSEGKGLMAQDIRIAASLSIGASPTWLANNKYEFSGVDAETAKQNLCTRNPGLAGCNAKLSSTASVPAGGCGS